jgi:hypothetical protein
VARPDDREPPRRSNAGHVPPHPHPASTAGADLLAAALERDLVTADDFAR